MLVEYIGNEASFIYQSPKSKTTYRFNGEPVEITDNQDLTWMLQPRFRFVFTEYFSPEIKEKKEKERKAAELKEKKIMQQAEIDKQKELDARAARTLAETEAALKEEVEKQELVDYHNKKCAEEEAERVATKGETSEKELTEKTKQDQEVKNRAVRKIETVIEKDVANKKTDSTLTDMNMIHLWKLLKAANVTLKKAGTAESKAVAGVTKPGLATIVAKAQAKVAKLEKAA